MNNPQSIADSESDDEIVRLLAQYDGDPNAPVDSTIRNLHRELETIASDLRAPVDSDPHADEPEVEVVLRKLQSIPRPQDSGNQATAQDVEQLNADFGDIGPYQLLEKLGQGGMGAVYKAVHNRLKKQVAIKVLPKDKLGDADAVARFEREMIAIGQLDHPHLVRAMDAGEVHDTHYLVMEYVDGFDLSKLLGHELPIADACELVRQAALGLHIAHLRGMVHRDIKPSNLMLARQEFGPPVVKVLDLGLALLSDDDTAIFSKELTQDGHIMGTIDYMAPEQAGDSHNVDIRADIYSLGAALFALLIGESIIQSRGCRTMIQKLSSLANDPPPDIRQNRPDVPEELAGIIEWMLARDPVARPTTPAEVAAALEPFTQGAELQSLLTLPSQPMTSIVDPTVRVDTKPSVASAQSTSPELVLPGQTVAEDRTSDPAMAQPSQSGDRGNGRRRNRRGLLAGSFGALVLFGVIVLSLKTPHGEVIVELGDGVPAEAVKIEVSGNGQLQIADAAEGWNIAIKEGQYTAHLAGSDDRFQLDKQQVTVTRGEQSLLKVSLKPLERKGPAKQQISQSESKSPSRPAEPSPDMEPQTVVKSSAESKPKSPEPAPALTTLQEPERPAWQPVPMGESPLDNLDPGTIPAAERYAGQPEELVAVLGSRQNRHWYEVNWVDWSSDGRWVASRASIFDAGNMSNGVSERRVLLWDARTRQLAATIDPPDGTLVFGCAFTPDGQRLVVAGSKAIWLCDLSADKPGFIPWGGPEGPMVLPGGSAQSLRFSSDGLTMIGMNQGAGWSFVVKVWDLSGRVPRLRVTIPGLDYRSGYCNGIADVSPDGKTVAYCKSNPNRVELVDLSESEIRAKATIDYGDVVPCVVCAFAHDGRTLAVGGADGKEVTLYDLTSDSDPPTVRTTLRHDDTWMLNVLHYSPDGKWFAKVTHTNVALWNLTVEQIGPEPTAVINGGARCFAFGPRSDSIVLNRGNTISWFDLSGGQPQQLDPQPTQPAVSLAPTRLVYERGWLPLWGSDGKTQLWNLTGSTPKPLPWLDPELSAIRSRYTYLTPDGQHMAESHVGHSRWLAWTPSGYQEAARRDVVDYQGSSHIGSRGWVLVKFDDRSSPWSLWNIQQPPETARTLDGFVWPEKVRSVAISPDGRWLAVDRGGIELWDVSGPSAVQRDVLPSPFSNTTDFMRFSTDSRRLVILSHAVALMNIYDLSGPQPKRLAAPASILAYQTDAAFTPDGRRLVVSSQTGSLAAFDLELGFPVWETKFPGHIGSVAVADDGRHIFTSNGDGTVYVLRVPDLMTRPGPFDPVNPAAERKAAEWVASFPGHRCTVITLEGKEVRITDGKVPDEPFYVSVVNLSGLDIDDDSLAHLAGCRRITYLSMEGNPRLTDESLKHLAGLRSLTVLGTNTGEKTGIGNGLADLVRQSPNLYDLKLPGYQVTNAFLPSLEKCPNLAYLYLPGGEAPFDLAELAIYCPNLRYLNMPSGSRISSARAISQLLRLERLVCNGKFLSGPAGTALARTPNLEDIGLWVPTDTAVAHVSRMSGQLRRLTLTERSENGGGLTSSGYRSLADTQGLDNLLIRNTDISPSDEDLLGFTKIRTLRHLTLSFPEADRRYTAEGIDAFRKQRRDVTLEVDGRKWEAGQFDPPTEGVSGPALLFDGRSSQVRLSDVYHKAATPLTLEAWVFPTVPSRDGQGVLTNWDGNGCGLVVWGGKWHYVMGIGSHHSTNSISDVNVEPAQWVHIAGVFENGKLRTYVNGKLQSHQPELTRDYDPSPHTFLIGAYHRDNRFFAGAIDEVRISNVARYDGDFTPAKRFEPDADTVALYHFDEGEGDIAHDSSGNDHHGKITGAKWFPAVTPDSQ